MFTKGARDIIVHKLSSKTVSSVILYIGLNLWNVAYILEELGNCTVCVYVCVWEGHLPQEGALFKACLELEGFDMLRVPMRGLGLVLRCWFYWLTDLIDCSFIMILSHQWSNSFAVIIVIFADDWMSLVNRIWNLIGCMWITVDLLTR